MRGPLLAFRDCENYQSEAENGSDENKPCFNLRTFVGVKTRVLFHLEHKIHLLHGNAACLSPTLRPQREATILESHFSLLSSFFILGKTNVLIICQKPSFYLYRFYSSESRVLFLFCLFNVLRDAMGLLSRAVSLSTTQTQPREDRSQVNLSRKIKTYKIRYFLRKKSD